VAAFSASIRSRFRRRYQWLLQWLALVVWLIGAKGGEKGDEQRNNSKIYGCHIAARGTEKKHAAQREKYKRFY